MSRIGKKPIKLPSSVNVALLNQTVEVKGPKGTRTFTADNHVGIEVNENEIYVIPLGSSKRALQHWGMSRTQIANCVTGVVDGFKKELEINGVGYRAQMVE